MKKKLILAIVLVFGMFIYLSADDQPNKTRQGRNTDAYGYERSNEVNKGKQGELMKEKNAREQEQKKEQIRSRKETQKEAKQAKKEARETKKEMKREKHQMKKNE